MVNAKENRVSQSPMSVLANINYYATKSTVVTENLLFMSTSLKLIFPLYQLNPILALAYVALVPWDLWLLV